MRGSGGYIEVVCGPMFSGKTEELIRRMRRAEIARQDFLIFKPAIDSRYDKNDVASHSGQKAKSFPVDGVAGIRKHLDTIKSETQGSLDKYKIIAIDEAQFFDKSLPELVFDLADMGKRVILAGLDQDYFGRPFGPMPELLAMADSVTKQSAVCMVCTAPATKTQRVSDLATDQNFKQPETQVHVGATEAYEARCRQCFVPRVDVTYLKLIEDLL